MKLLFENKELILEFNKKDEAAVLKDGEKFTVAFEIELETNDSEFDCDLIDMMDGLHALLPNFMKKYEANLDLKEDGSLECGIEFTMEKPKYMTGLKNAIEFLRIFFQDFKKQKAFFFTHETGLHVNIGYLDEGGELEGDYNLFKALTFLNHSHATTGMGFPSREGVHWARDLKEPAIEDIEKFLKKLPKSLQNPESKLMSKNKLMKMYLERNFDGISKILSDEIKKTAGKTWSKKQGFNVDHVDGKRYIEFRYPGHRDPNLKNMTKALLYYSFIVKAATDPEFKKRDYIKDLIGFFNEAMEEKSSAVKSPFLREFNKGMKFLEQAKTPEFSIFSYLENALFSSIDWEKARLINRPSSHLADLSKKITEKIIYWAYGGLIHVLEDRTLVVYNGLSKGKVSLDRLALNPFALSTRFGASANMEREIVSPKEFQNRLGIQVRGDVYLMPVHHYHRGRDQDLKKIIDVILNSSSALDISEKLYSAALESGYVDMDDYLKAFPLKSGAYSDYSKSDEEKGEEEDTGSVPAQSTLRRTLTRMSPEEANRYRAMDPDEAMNQLISGWPPTEEEIQSLVDAGILVRKTPTKKDKKLSELKQYFKKYKF